MSYPTNGHKPEEMVPSEPPLFNVTEHYVVQDVIGEGAYGLVV